MNSLSFTERINLYILEDLISKLAKYPNKYFLKLVNNITDNMKNEIMNDPRLSAKLKQKYLDIVKDPDLLENIKIDDLSLASSVSSISTLKDDRVIAFKNYNNEDSLITEEVDLNIYDMYKMNPQLINNFNIIKGSLLFY